MTDALFDLNLRSLLLLAVAVAGLYFIVLGLRFLRLRQRAKAAGGERQAPTVLEPAAAPASAELPREPRFSDEPFTRSEPLPRSHRPRFVPEPEMEPARPIEMPLDASYAPAYSAPASSSLPSFDAALGVAAAETRLQSVLAEVQSLREELAQLRNDVARLEASRNVSPLYGEAVSLAQQGMDAATIAVRCGISIAEAELVTSLSGQIQSAAAGNAFHEEEYS